MPAMATPPRKVSLLWPDTKKGPWVVAVWWRVQYGVPTPVGMSIAGWLPEGNTKAEGGSAAGAPLDEVYDAVLRWRAEGIPESGDEVEFPRLDSSLIRSLPVGQLFDAAREELVRRLDPLPEADRGKWSGDSLRTLEAWDEEYRPEREALSRPRGGRDLGDDHYREVASIYAKAVTDKKPPTAAVADHFTVSKSAAAKKVARARERGFLPPTTRGRVGRLTEEL